MASYSLGKFGSSSAERPVILFAILTLNATYIGTEKKARCGRIYGTLILGEMLTRKMPMTGYGQLSLVWK